MAIDVPREKLRRHQRMNLSVSIFRHLLEYPHISYKDYRERQQSTTSLRRKRSILLSNGLTTKPILYSQFTKRGIALRLKVDQFVASIGDHYGKGKSLKHDR